MVNITMQLPYSKKLNIEYFGRLFDNTSECHKFFWLKAILLNVTKSKLELSYKEYVDKMIADAWYMVTEYHLNLGSKDTLENLINFIKEKYSHLQSNEKKSVFISLKIQTIKKFFLKNEF